MKENWGNSRRKLVNYEIPGEIVLCLGSARESGEIS
jgi:hypothetical protein